jgi:hypothetical protein
VANGTTVVVTGTTDCWRRLTGSATASGGGRSSALPELALVGRRAQCGGDDDVNGVLGARRGSI